MQAIRDEQEKEDAERKYMREEIAKCREQLHLNEETRVGMVLKIRGLNEKYNQTLKEVKKLQSELKFERIATEGAKKKSAVFEFEVVGLREEKANFSQEASLYKVRVQELEHALNEERSKRLQNMHENEKLQMINAQLTTKNESLEKSAHDANMKLLEKIQKLETATLLNESKSRVISSQSTDLNHLSDDLFRGKAEERSLHSTILSTNDDLRQLKVENHNLKRELSSVRKDMMEISIQQSDKMKAVGGKHAARTRASTSLGRSRSRKSDFGSFDFDQSFDSSIFSAASYESEKTGSGRVSAAAVSTRSSISPLASPMRPQSIHMTFPKSPSEPFSPTGSATFSSFLDEENRYNLSNNPGAAVTLPDVSLSSPMSKAPTSLAEVALERKDSNRSLTGVGKLKRASSEHSNRPKTKFVGSGLGYKTSQIFSPKGSAKEMLKKIMNEFDA